MRKLCISENKLHRSLCSSVLINCSTNSCMLSFLVPSGIRMLFRRERVSRSVSWACMYLWSSKLSSIISLASALHYFMTFIRCSVSETLLVNFFMSEIILFSFKLTSSVKSVISFFCWYTGLFFHVCPEIFYLFYDVSLDSFHSHIRTGG